MTYTVEFRDVSKRYYLGGFGGSLREAVPRLARRLIGKKSTEGRAQLWALRDLSFRIGPGEAVAIIGPNGAGKTTALKLATFVTQPTQGEVSVLGRTSALIELGAGFHPDLSGRENIFLNGTILGLKRREIQRRFDAIVEFSELERFLDTPVKRYSSGMYARLGFSVAAHVNPEILIVDEVLAVGDLAFQAKCLARMAEMKRLGVTILIVSHQLPRLRRLCDRGIFLHRGELVVDGPIDEAIVAYQAHQESGARTADSPGSEAGEPPKSSILAASPVALTQVAVLDGLGQPSAVCQAGGRLVVRVSYHARQSVESPICEVWVHAADGTEFACCTTRWDGVAWGPIEGDGHIDLAFDPVCLAAGRYLISAAITAADGITRYDWHWQRYTLEIATSHSMQGLVYQPHEWRLGVQ